MIPHIIYKDNVNHHERHIQGGRRKILYTNKEMLELLRSNNATLKKYRDGGYLQYSKIGDKYFYSMSDIQAFLRNTQTNLIYSVKRQFSRRQVIS